jgi:hypothetical protein
LVKKSKQEEEQLVTYRANAEDEVTSNGFLVLQYRKPLNRRGTVHIPRDKGHDAREVKSILLSKNADIGFNDDSNADREIERALQAGPREHWLFAARTGWRRDVFVLPHRAVGTQRKLRIKPPQWIDERQQGLLGQAGDLDSWNSRVAEVCRYSSRLMLTVSAAFAAPLLARIGRPSFWLHMFGPAKLGKTLALLAGGSVIGIGDDRQLPTWNTTDTAFQETARLFNDNVLIVDEFGLLKGNRKDAYLRVKNLTYMFSAGKETSRSRQSVYAVPPASSPWRSILVSTGEHSVGALAGLSGESRDAGELARTHDIPAIKGRQKTIFDRFPPNLAKKKRRSWSRRQLAALREAIASNHGQALEPVIVEIIRRGEAIRPFVEKCTREFRKALPACPKEGALMHAADNFGVVYAGGCLAIKTGVVPWSQDELLGALTACFEGFLEEVGKQEKVRERAQRIFLKRLGEMDLPLKSKPFDAKPQHGFRTQTDRGIIFAIGTKAFDQMFPLSDRRRLALEVLRWLEEHGKLAKTGSASGSSSERSGRGWAVTWAKWGKGKGMRAIQFLDPRG